MELVELVETARTAPRNRAGSPAAREWKRFSFRLVLDDFAIDISSSVCGTARGPEACLRNKESAGMRRLR